MAKEISRFMSGIPFAQNVFVLPPLAFHTVTSQSGLGVYASSDTLFKGAVFGRDSLEVAEDIMAFRPALVRTILLTLADKQGTVFNDKNEEEPGKIVHEYRNVITDDEPIDEVSLRIFNELSHKWGGTNTELTYYGSVDVTPYFLRVLGAYCAKRGKRLLATPLKSRPDVSLGEAAEAAATWLVGKLKMSRSGLLEYKKINPHGISNQAWKDSEEFYVHENGEIANHQAPIASIEIQALAYDGLYAAAHLFPHKADEYTALANSLRDITIKLLWQKERQYFALGTDFDTTNKLRVIRTTTANPAALLDSGFFGKLPTEEREKYVSAITRKIMSWDFLTDAGIRSRALSESGLITFWDYHGSFVSWPKETYDVAKGLRRYGMPLLAKQLENRLLNVVLKNRAYPEFVYVDAKGRILSRSSPTQSHGELVLVDSTNNPERVQAWTVSAVLDILNQRLNAKITLKPRRRPSWQKELESELLKKIPKISTHLNPFTLRVKYPTYRYKLKKDT